VPATGRLARGARVTLRARIAMAITQSHAIAVGGIAVVGLAGGFGIARATGGDAKPPPAKTQSAADGLPAVEDSGDAVRIAGLNAVATLPARKTSRRRQRPDNSGPAPSSTPAPSATSAPAPSATSAPPSRTAAPPASTPAPVRTPVVGGGTGGEEP